MQSAAPVRPAAVRRGKQLEYITIAWNSVEAVVSIASGWVAGSVSLIGFGLDSLIEVTSGAAVLWRLRGDHHIERRESAERISLRIVGWCFLALAVYVLIESAESLLRREAPSKACPASRLPFSLCS